MSENQTPEVDIETFDRQRSNGVVVDVRETAEHATGHVPGAQLIPMGHLPSRMGELDKEQPVYVICAAGGRSSAMTDLLVASGFDARSVAGGTNAWIESGRPLEGRTR